MSTAPRVMFLHGLESGPGGIKPRLLREQGFEVDAPDMQMGVWQVDRRNAVARQLLNVPEARWLAAVVGVGVGVSLLTRSSMLLGATLLGGAAWGYLRRRELMAQAMARSFDACVDIARAAIVVRKPDVLVGSSFGGAVAAALVLDGTWNGPTVLLAPAIQKLAAWSGRGDGGLEVAALRARSHEVPLLVFHDPTDDVVPHADSAVLAEDSEIDVRSVDAGGHRLVRLLERGELAAALRTLVAG